MPFQRNSLRNVALILACLPSVCGTSISQAQQDIAEINDNKTLIARGTVFHDSNPDGRIGDDEKRLSGVRLSNGRDIVTTDENGIYEIGMDDDDILFVIKPQEYRTRLDKNNLPMFYYTHKPAGSPKLRFPGVAPTGPLPDAIDFPLYAQDEPETFHAILFGDPQSRNAIEVSYMNRTTIPELIGSKAAFGVTLGDILFDDLSFFESQNQSVGMIGIPWYNVIGNHDINMDTSERRFSNETFERFYGPSWYSFDYGQVHFVVLDNINWFLPDGETRGTYNGTFGDEQLRFLANDLAGIPDDKFVVLFMHIPLPDCTDASAIYRLIENRPVSFSVSAHKHAHSHVFLGAEQGWLGKQPHHHMVNVTVCGSWWSGQKDANGIPHATMTDGGPYGYTTVTFDGGSYVIDFKAAGLPASYQMNVQVADFIPESKCDGTPIHVNVFNGSERTTVQMRIDGSDEWQTLEKILAEDPRYVALVEQEKLVTPAIEPALAKPGICEHLWTGTLGQLAVGQHLIEVRATDMHGRTFESQRIVCVTAD